MVEEEVGILWVGRLPTLHVFVDPSPPRFLVEVVVRPVAVVAVVREVELLPGSVVVRVVVVADIRAVVLWPGIVCVPVAVP